MMHFGSCKKVLPVFFLTGLLTSMVGCDQAAQQEMDHISNQVAEDQIKQYEILKRSGSKMEIAMQASIIAQCYLGAKDEENFKKWKAIAKVDGKRAGMPAEP